MYGELPHTGVVAAAVPRARVKPVGTAARRDAAQGVLTTILFVMP